jgi:hypothetical protein
MHYLLKDARWAFSGWAFSCRAFLLTYGGRIMSKKPLRRVNPSERTFTENGQILQPSSGGCAIPLTFRGTQAVRFFLCGLAALAIISVAGMSVKADDDPNLAKVHAKALLRIAQNADFR